MLMLCIYTAVSFDFIQHLSKNMVILVDAGMCIYLYRKNYTPSVLHLKY